MKKLLIIILSTIALCISCGKGNTGRVGSMSYNRIDSISCSESAISFRFKGKDSVQINYIIKYEGDSLYSTSLSAYNDSTYSLPKITKGALKKYAYEIAYTIASEDSFPIRYSLISDTTFLFDTIVYYKKASINEQNIYAQLTSNNFAKFNPTTYKDYIKDSKVFLVNKGIRADDNIIEKMSRYLFYLITDGVITYKSASNIPIYKELPTFTETISTNVNADYFYLVLANSEEMLLSFIKEEIVNDFSNGVPNTVIGNKKIRLSPIKKGYDYLYLFLCGLNKDWTYDYIPIGNVLIDNIAPSLIFDHQHDLHDYLSRFDKSRGKSKKFKNYYIDNDSLFHNITSRITSFKWGKFEGDNFFGYTIPFTLKGEFGDLDAIVIKGKKIKVVPDYNNRGILTEPVFRFEHHFSRLNIGDNYIKIDFIDERGNKSTATINIGIERVRDIQDIHLKID